jgi:spermidine/putrescine transport system permease protein
MSIKAGSRYFIYAWLFFFGVLPLSVIAIASVLSENHTHLITLPFTFKNYIALFNPGIAHIFGRSLLMASVTTAIILLLAYPFSYFMVKSKHKSMHVLLIVIPFWTSSLVRTYALIAILKVHGILNTVLLKLHVIQHPLLLLYSNTAVIIGLVYTLFPFMVLPLFTQMERFDFRLLEAALDLGASKMAFFFRIFLPNTLQGIISGSLLVFLPAMTLFYIPNILGGARSILLGNLIQNQFFILDNWPEGAATSLLLTGLLLMMMAIYQKYRRNTP